MKFKLGRYNKNISDNDILNDLKRVAKLLRSPTVNRSQYKIHGKYSVSTIRHHFGSWNRGLKLAGLKITRNYNLYKADLFYNLQKVWMNLKRAPGYKDMKPPLSEYSVHMYKRRFGSFRAALEEFVKHANRRRIHKTPDPFAGKLVKKNRTSRNINYMLRYKVLTRDDYTCVKCGRSPANEKGVRLHVDHIKPYSKGGESVINNLQTLCRECNIGKGDKL
jgi:5-methylcytosine-specific restriction endonuclease McrA